MHITTLQAKIHRATVTGADLHYEGSISIDKRLIEAAGMRLWQQVDIYNIDNGERFSTYIIEGGPGEITLNGAAARRVSVGDKVIIAAYCQIDQNTPHQPTIVLVDDQNRPRPTQSK